MNIAVIGIGGVGGYFGGKLTQLLKSEKDLHISFVARGQHMQEIRKNGLLLDTDEGEYVCHPSMITDTISELPDIDFCLLCVKSYDLENVLQQLKSKVKDNTIILPLLNGVDIYERIRPILTNAVVLPSCVYVGTHIEKPGKVTQRGGACTIHFGKDPQKDTMNPRIFDLFKKASIKHIWTDDPYPEIWSKFIFIASFGLVTARFGNTLGEIAGSDEKSTLVKQIMEEIYSIAKKKNIALPTTIVESSFSKARSFPFEAKTSFHRDYEKGKKDERDLFGGAVIRMGKALGVKTTATESIYNAL